MSDRWSRLAPLTAVIFVGLFVASIVVSGSTPGVHASGAKVISYAKAHHGREMPSDGLLAIGMAFLLFFAASLRAYLRRAERAEALAALGLAGAVLLAVGGTSFAALDFSINDARNTLDPSAAQALNVLSNDFFFPLVIGIGVFMIGNGLAIVRSRALPRWLGWVAFVLGIVGMTPAGFFAFIGVMAWSLIVCVLISTCEAAGRPHPPLAVRRMPWTPRTRSGLGSSRADRVERTSRGSSRVDRPGAILRTPGIKRPRYVRSAESFARFLPV